jgi:hypothetical protein
MPELYSLRLFACPIVLAHLSGGLSYELPVARKCELARSSDTLFCPKPLTVHLFVLPSQIAKKTQIISTQVINSHLYSAYTERPVNLTPMDRNHEIIEELCKRPVSRILIRIRESDQVSKTEKATLKALMKDHIKTVPRNMMNLSPRNEFQLDLMKLREKLSNGGPKHRYQTKNITDGDGGCI